MFNRVQEKQDAKGFLAQHRRFFFILFIPFLICTLFSQGSTSMPNNVDSSVKIAPNFHVDQFNFIWPAFSSQIATISIISIVSSIFLMGAIFVIINALRGKEDFQRPLRKSLTFIDNQTLFWRIVGLAIVRFILVMLWCIPFFVAMIVSLVAFQSALLFAISFALLALPVMKSFAYSQAIYVYRDAFLSQKDITVLSAIKQSQDLMNGHKMEYFILQLSFIGWNILVTITLGIAGIYVFPYYYITMMKFYLCLQKDSSDPEEIIM